MAIQHYDVFIVGGGQAGIPLAWQLAGAGRTVALAERKHLGGSCVNFGCTPTKAAIASAKLAHQARRAAEYGLLIPTVTVDFPAVLARACRIVLESREGLEKSFADADNPRLLSGHAHLDGREGDAFRLRVGDETVTAGQVVLNTGTRSRLPDIPGIATVPLLHADIWLDHPELPRHLALLGAGYIGLEMGQFYRRMGSQVTIFDHNPRVAPQEDEDVSAALQTCLEAEGIVFQLGVEVKEIADSKTSAGREILLRYEHAGEPRESRVTHLFAATGRKPNTDDLGLETVGIRMVEHGNVAVDERLATNVEGIWAAGDIRGGPLFTHTSWDDSRILFSQMAGDRSRTTKRIVPYALFTDPELGRVGLTEREARQSGRRIKTATYEMTHSGKASEIGETAGFIKVIADADTDRLLGAAVLSAEGAELVHLLIDLMNADAPCAVIANAIHIHPTLAEAVQSAISAMK